MRAQSRSQVSQVDIAQSALKMIQFAKFLITANPDDTNDGKPSSHVHFARCPRPGPFGGTLGGAQRLSPQLGIASVMQRTPSKDCSPFDPA